MAFWHEGQAAQVETKNSIRHLCEFCCYCEESLQYCPILCSSGKAAGLSQQAGC